MNGSVKNMAYGGNDTSSQPNQTYRMQRNTPFMRAGQVVASIPKFKALATYTPTPHNVQKGLRTTMTYTRVGYPQPSVPNATSGGT
jgi:hypothetical protein